MNMTAKGTQLNSLMQRQHPVSHHSRTQPIGAGLVRIVCENCEYLGIDLIAQSSIPTDLDDPQPSVSIGSDPWELS